MNHYNMSFVGDEVSNAPTSAGLPPSILSSKVTAKQSLGDFINSGKPRKQSFKYNPFEPVGLNS